MKKLLLSIKTSLTIFGLLLALTSPSSYADDLEVYGVSETENLPVNVLFIFDVSGSMGWAKNGDKNPPVGESRYEIMLEALRNVLDENKNTNNLKVGVSWFSKDASGIRWPITDILADAHDIDNDIPVGAFKSYEIIPHLLETNAQPSGNTGIVQALLEASFYFRGEKVWAGENEPDEWDTSSNDYDATDSNDRLWPAMRKTYTASANSDFWEDAVYNSPIIDNCTPNFIVLLSDGQPTSSSQSAKDQIISMTGVNSCANVSSLSHAKCGKELVKFLADNDQITGKTGTDVRTFTIGFNISGNGKTFLEDLAEEGNGEFYSASDASDLETAFNHIINSITAENESFSSLVTTIRASTLSSDNRVFLNMFKPAETRSWYGNTKGYFIDSTGLLDVDGVDAVADDPDGPGKLDKFTTLSRSFWSSSADGNFVNKGGASENIESNNSRKIYTYTSSDAPDDSALTQITVNSSSITNTMMDTITDNERKEVLSWLLNDAGMGDPLHAKPIMITYTDSSASKQDVLFSMTNQGLLHAFDTTKPTGFSDYSGGEELFSFIPQTLLQNLKDHKANLISSDHLYGLDGSLSYYHEDTDNDTFVDSNEKVYLYFGMRRGGRNYYALDVSDLSNPKLMWRIEGGKGDFVQLGQTWSRMTPTTINWNSGSTKKVLIFGGGYDEGADNHSTRTADTMGNAIFIVNALTGKKIWKATKGNNKVDSNNRMKYSIPGDIRVIDSNFNGIADRLYFSDIGGQVWRIDLVDENDAKNITGYVLANITSNNNEAGYRRFYSVPEVAKMKDGSSFYYAVAVGSGFRAHPNSLAVNDRVFMIKDSNVDTGAPNTTTAIIKNSNLLNITNNVDADDISSKMTNKNGWRLHLTNIGEKSLTPMLIFNSQLAFTTFTPTSEEEAANNNSCSGGGGTGRYYLINLENGAPVKDFYDESTPQGNLTAVNRSKTLPGQGIPTEVIRRFLSPEDGGGTQETVGKGIVGDSAEIVHKINWNKVE